jgi:hypothetical protein
MPDHQPRDSGPARAKRFLIDAGGFAAVLAALPWAYAPTLSLPLWGDDALHLYELREAARAFRALYDPAVALSVSMFWFRPVGDLSYTLDHRLWGLNAAGYHLNNLALHALVILALVGLVREWFHLRAGDRPPSPASVWLIALAFTLNPSAALTLARPSMRYDLYATLLVLVSLLAFCKWQRGTWASGRTVALGAALAAFASKESAVVLLPLLVLVSGGGLRRRLRATWPFAAALCVYVGWRFVVLQGPGGYPWVSWSWQDVLRPDRYVAAAMAVARDGWPGMSSIPPRRESVPASWRKRGPGRRASSASTAPSGRTPRGTRRKGFAPASRRRGIRRHPSRSLRTAIGCASGAPRERSIRAALSACTTVR